MLSDPDDYPQMYDPKLASSYDGPHEVLFV